ncbi:MAG: hypothetical protein MJK04_03905 [Psychrosphaera sp.]|nr:hypothetical protein [Psychrosphaera sp.]
MIKIIFALSLYLLTFAFAPASHANTYYSLGSDKEVLGAGFAQQLNMPLDTCLDGD